MRGLRVRGMGRGLGYGEKVGGRGGKREREKRKDAEEGHKSREGVREERWRCSVSWVTGEQRDELMRRRVNAKKLEEWAALIGVYVRSLIMKTKNRRSCSEGFVLLMQREQKQSRTCVHLTTPAYVEGERISVSSCGCKAKCVAFFLLSVTCSLITTMTAVRLVPGDEWAPAPFPKWPSKGSKTKWLFYFLYFPVCLCVCVWMCVWCTPKVPSPHLGHFPAAEIA